MSKKRDIKRRGPTLREYVLVPITDPAEQAVIERKRKRAMRALAAAEIGVASARSSKRR